MQITTRYYTKQYNLTKILKGYKLAIKVYDNLSQKCLN